MFRTAIIALAAAAALGTSVASAAPVNGSVIAGAAQLGDSFQEVRYRHRHHFFFIGHAITGTIFGITITAGGEAITAAMSSR